SMSLSLSTNCQTFRAGVGLVPGDPASKLVDRILSTPTDEARAMDLPILSNIKRVAFAPYFDSDGRLVQKPEYDATTQIWLDLTADLYGMPTVSPSPTAKEVEDAAKLLCDDLLGDFLFYTNADPAAAFPTVLSP